MAQEKWEIEVLEAGGVMVGDRVSIEIEIEAVKQTAVKAA
jgi:urease accessory protein UreH